MHALDSSILVAALVEIEQHHEACEALLGKSRASVYAHALTETFNTLTGGRSGYRVPARQAAQAIEQSILPSVNVIVVSSAEMIAAMQDSEQRGVRGAAIFDYLHLVAARKARATKLYTLNISDFRSFHRAGDPEIVHP